jgi:hypothetical protein
VGQFQEKHILSSTDTADDTATPAKEHLSQSTKEMERIVPAINEMIQV